MAVLNNNKALTAGFEYANRDVLEKARRLSYLLIDDSRHTRGMIMGALQGYGLRSIEIAQTVPEAIGLLSMRPVDIVLTSLEMPGVTALELVRMIRRRAVSGNHKIPIFVLSSLADPEVIASVRDAGVDGFIMLPVAPQGLMERLLRCLKTTRNFVDCEAYVGPDRRRRKILSFEGQDRRSRRA